MSRTKQMQRSPLLITALVILAVGCSKQDNLRENQMVTQDQTQHPQLKKYSGNLSVEVIRAPVAPDGTSAAASTDIVLNFRDLDPGHAWDPDQNRW